LAPAGAKPAAGHTLPMGTITLNDPQQRKCEILQRLKDDTISSAEAAQLLGRSARQVQRMLSRFTECGMASVIHGNRGRSPANKTSTLIVDRIVQVAGNDGKYHDFNACHMQELLAEHEDLLIGRSTLDRLLKEKQLRKPPRKQPVKRRRRDRKSAEGMLLQIDGSTHRWVEERGPKMCLIGAVDDATGKVLHLCFRPTEDQIGYLMLIQDIACRLGLPMAYYHDRHTILLSPKKATIDDELAGRKPMSQLQRVLDELGVESIAAHSPQAKGRIERLWGTLQDRLLKELRLAQVSEIDDANAMLPAFIEAYNQRFAKQAKDPEPAWVTLPAGIDLNYYFSTREERIVQNDHTIKWYGKILQLATGPLRANMAGRRVYVHTNAQQETFCYYEQRALSFKTIAPEAQTKPKAPSMNNKPELQEEQRKRSRRRQTAHLHAGL
jgi:transposase